jgi:hypothetical protein
MWSLYDPFLAIMYELEHVGFDVLTAVTMKSPVFFGSNASSSERARRFGGTCLHFMGKTVRKARNKQQ